MPARRAPIPGAFHDSRRRRQRHARASGEWSAARSGLPRSRDVAGSVESRGARPPRCGAGAGRPARRGLGRARRAEVVVAAAHSILGRGRHASAHVDGAGHRRLIDIARAAGARHFVYTSVRDAGLAYDSVPFVRIKKEVERYLRSSGLSHTIVRPTAFMDLHAHVLIGEPVLAGRRVILIGPGERPRNYVAAADIARLVVRAVSDSRLAGRTITIGSSRDLSPMDVVRTYERRAGRRAAITRMPLLAARALSRALAPVHPGVSQLLQLSVVTERDGELPLDPSHPDVEISSITLETWIESRLGDRPNPEP